MTDQPQQPAQPGIAINSVAAHFQRQAAYFQNEALGLAAQVRELQQVNSRLTQQIASITTPAVQAKPRKAKATKSAA